MKEKLLQKYGFRPKRIKYTPPVMKDMLWEKDIPKIRHTSWLGLDLVKRKEHLYYLDRRGREDDDMLFGTLSGGTKGLLQDS